MFSLKCNSIFQEDATQIYFKAFTAVYCTKAEMKQYLLLPGSYIGIANITLVHALWELSATVVLYIMALTNYDIKDGVL